MSLTTATPFQTSWTYMVDSGKCPPGADWLSIVKKISLLSTVESFWSVFNNVVPPSSLPLNSTYHIFRDGIKPMWEDPANAKGGKWVMSMPRGRGGESNIKRVDEWWLYTVLAAVGETMGEEEGQVCGAVVSIRKVRVRVIGRESLDSSYSARHTNANFIGVPAFFFF